MMEVDEIPEDVTKDERTPQDNSSDDDISSLLLSDGDESNSDATESDDDFSSLREEALSLIEADNNLEFSEQEKMRKEVSDIFPRDFLKVYERLTEPKTMGGVVNLSDSDSEEAFEGDESKEPKCTVPSCSSRKKVKLRSRLITSYYGLSYIEAPLICHKCFIKAAKFYKKIAKIGPDKCKLLVNDITLKPTECIDICDDGPIQSGPVKMLDDDSLAVEMCRNIQSHINNVAEKYSIEERFKKHISKIENKIGKMTIWINELNCKLGMDDGSMVNMLQQMYSAYDPTLKQLEPLDTDIVDADNPEIKKCWESGSSMSGDLRRDHPDKSTIIIDSYSDPDIAIVEDCLEATLKKPSNLPPRGMIIRKKPSVKQKIYVSRQGDRTDWIPATIESIIINENVDDYRLSYTYRVLVGNSTSLTYIKEVKEEQMAYFEPSSVRIAVGNRVISVLYTKEKSDPKFYSGIVAESPSSNNQYRYMIMFESMAVQYSNHDDLRVTCEMRDDYHLYFPTVFQPFIRKYFELLPKRKILTVNTMDIVKVESKGRWVDAKVTAVDGLLMEVFYKSGQPTEWLYRGSPRVMSKDMYRGKLLRAYSDGTIRQVSRGGVFAEDDPLEVDKVMEMIANKTIIPKPDDMSSVRAVAKKTVTRLPETMHLQGFFSRSNSIYQNRNCKDEFAGFIKLNKDLGSLTLFPRDLGVHECDEKCILWTNRTLDSCRGRNPLIIPMLFAFRRVDVTPMGGAARQVYYETPCGLRLEDFDQLLTYLQKTKCQLSVDYFNFDSWVSVWDEFKAAPGGLVLKDLSYGKEFNMVPVVNTVDKELPPYMNYKVNRIATDGVPLNLDPEFLTGCDCTDDCSNKMTCPCWQKTIKDYLDLIVKTNTEMDSSSDVMDYSYIGYQNKRLVEYVPSGIYECNSTCKCSHTCLNRVVQLPLKVKLELFKTKYKGWGTRCLNDIPSGGFICVYVGNLLTEKAANEGGKTYGDEYFAELDYIEVMERLMNKPGYESGPSDPENTDEDAEGANEQVQESTSNSSMKLRKRKKNKDKKNRVKRSTTDQAQLRPGATGESPPDSSKPSTSGTSSKQTDSSTDNPPSNAYVPLRTLYGNNETVYIIDAKSAGNIGRYFNHSCDPNIFVQNVFVDTHDLRFPWVAFFAKHHIRAGSELTWDYQYIVDSVPGKKLYCYCGSKTCRGRLL